METETIKTISIPSGEASVFSDGECILGKPNSSSINRWQWTPKFFSVTYKSSDAVYFYYGVPFTVVVGLLATDSAGKFIANEVKAKYEVAHKS